MLNDYAVVIGDLWVENPPYWLRDYPILWDREWHVKTGRVGDLVFSDDAGEKFMVVQVKYIERGGPQITRVSLNNAKQRLKEQAEYCGIAWAIKHPGKQVYACAFINVDVNPPIWLIQEKNTIRATMDDNPLETSMDDNPLETYGPYFLLFGFTICAGVMPVLIAMLFDTIYHELKSLIPT